MVMLYANCLQNYNKAVEFSKKLIIFAKTIIFAT